MNHPPDWVAQLVSRPAFQDFAGSFPGSGIFCNQLSVTGERVIAELPRTFFVRITDRPDIIKLLTVDINQPIS